MSDIAIRVENLSKQFRIGMRKYSYYTLRDQLADSMKSILRRDCRPHSRNNMIWALKDVSFEVKHGEIVGFIGRNGAGKSTLLKILSRITEPTIGRAEIYGKVGSLLEVGTGFHPELTGRDNIYLNGAILGMKKAEINAKFDEIVAFSEVEKFIDTPVKRYSSGMYVRLAFAVAAHLEPEILIVDEVLAVGDAAFQKKCLGKMDDVAKEGRTVLFVSHNMAAITQLCGRALWFENGRLKFTGHPFEVVASYLLSNSVNQLIWAPSLSNEKSHAEFVIKSARVLSEDNQPTAVVAFDRQLQVEIAYEVIVPLRDLSVIFRVTDSQGNIIWTSWDTDTTEWKGCVRIRGCYISICKIPAGSLRPGRYVLSIGANISNVKLLCYHENVLAFDVSEVGYRLNLNRMGVITPLLAWEVKRTDGYEKH